VKVVVAILLIAAAPVCAQAQSVPRVSKNDAQRVVKIISGDQAKTQTYCDIDKLGEQVEQAYEKNDSKMVDELSDKIEALEKTLGPEYAALVDGLEQLDHIISEFTALNMLCRLREPEPPRH
jgi:prephenate dehydratase